YARPQWPFARHDPAQVWEDRRAARTDRREVRNPRPREEPRGATTTASAGQAGNPRVAHKAVRGAAATGCSPSRWSSRLRWMPPQTEARTPPGGRAPAAAGEQDERARSIARDPPATGRHWPAAQLRPRATSAHLRRRS